MALGALEPPGRVRFVSGLIAVLGQGLIERGLGHLADDQDERFTSLGGSDDLRYIVHTPARSAAFGLRMKPRRLGDAEPDTISFLLNLLH